MHRFHAAIQLDTSSSPPPMHMFFEEHQMYVWNTVAMVPWIPVGGWEVGLPDLDIPVDLGMEIGEDRDVRVVLGYRAHPF